jgi:hypothetical protein
MLFRRPTASETISWDVCTAVDYQSGQHIRLRNRIATRSTKYYEIPSTGWALKLKVIGSGTTCKNRRSPAVDGIPTEVAEAQCREDAGWSGPSSPAHPQTRAGRRFPPDCQRQDSQFSPSLSITSMSGVVICRASSGKLFALLSHAIAIRPWREARLSPGMRLERSLSLCPRLLGSPRQTSA